MNSLNFTQRVEWLKMNLEIINKIIEEANKLAGEKFDLNTPITSLSEGSQER